MNESIYDKMTNAEKEVATVLKRMGITWIFEKPVFVWDDHNRPRVWTPDFYLIPFGVYIEVCGSSSFDYEYRKRIFYRKSYRVIFLHLFKHNEVWINHFIKYIQFFCECENELLDRII